MIKRLPPKLLVCTLVTLLSGCFRLASAPTVDLGRFTPESTGSSPSIVDETTAANGQMPAITPTPRLDSATQTLLRAYPLWVGSSWVYDYLGYDRNTEVLWRVVETVVDTRLVNGYYVAEVERVVELLEGSPGADFLSTPDEGTFWFVIDGKSLYRFDSEMTTDLDTAWLDLIIPFPEDSEAWTPDPDLRGMPEPAATGFRTASAPFQRNLSMGDTYTCYNIATRYVNGTAEGTFCETVGFVYQAFNQADQAFGYRLELIGFSLQ